MPSSYDRLAVRLQLLLLNGSHDRETACCGSHSGPMRASDVVQAITDALNRRRWANSLYAPGGLLNGLLYAWVINCSVLSNHKMCSSIARWHLIM